MARSETLAFRWADIDIVTPPVPLSRRERHNLTRLMLRGALLLARDDLRHLRIRITSCPPELSGSNQQNDGCDQKYFCIHAALTSPSGDCDAMAVYAQFEKKFL